MATPDHEPRFEATVRALMQHSATDVRRAARALQLLLTKFWARWRSTIRTDADARQVRDQLSPHERDVLEAQAGGRADLIAAALARCADRYATTVDELKG
jgi:hypothetical protein